MYLTDAPFTAVFSKSGERRRPLGDWNAMGSAQALDNALVAVSLAVIALAGLIAVLAGYFILTECMAAQDPGGPRIGSRRRRKRRRDADFQRAAGMATAEELGPIQLERT
jgi:hypothetical protein